MRRLLLLVLISSGALADEYSLGARKPNKLVWRDNATAAIAGHTNFGTSGTPAGWSGTGSVTHVPSRTGTYNAYKTGATSGTDANGFVGSVNIWNWKVGGRVDLDAQLIDLTNVRACIGMSSSTTGTCDSDTPASINGWWLRYSSSVGANWYCCAGNNTTTTCADSGVAADTARHNFSLLLPGGSAKAYIDGVEVCSSFSGGPDADGEWNKPTVAISTTENAIKELRWFGAVTWTD